MYIYTYLLDMMKINEKNLCVFATSPPFDCEGFLNKRGEINKAFQRRYFVLKGNLLFYFEKKGDKEPLGLIIVEGCTIELSEESDQYCFEIAFNGNRTYILSADSQEMMENWMKALTCAGYEYKKLVVAELQRQLEEIEFSRNKSIIGNSPIHSQRSNKNDFHNTVTSAVFESCFPIANVLRNKNYTFEQLHEHLRQVVMKDVLIYRTEQLLKSQPLIEL
ncbi:sesquipedalian-1 isoform X3 [Bactrocera dorsalis]|uniref:Sesquipedalian-1 isoform X3 n=1 Tax=Bactrocera dorsalis TaxID=27457 RepID=A0ABM3IYK5_BACDO|nr:sesquipedalian-1 isoform X3 [Bactrocera dorsalis]